MNQQYGANKFNEFNLMTLEHDDWTIWFNDT